MRPTFWSFAAVALAGWIHRRQGDVIAYLREENRVLREELGRKRLRFTDAQRRRLAEKAKLLGRSALREVASIVSPETLLGWYRALVAAKYDGSRKRRGPGRPPKPAAIRDLVLRMARENPRWGYTRIAGALAHVGHAIGKTTVKAILLEAGLDPAPERGRQMSWDTFLKAHWEVLAACDFFTVELLTVRGLVRTLVFVAMELATRTVHVAGIAPDPQASWVVQAGRNLTDPDFGFLRGKKFLIHDRDPLYTKPFLEVLRAAGVESVRLPARSPNLNAFVERFVRTIRSECLERLILPTEGALRRAVEEFCAHYHQERPHQGLDNRLIDSSLLTPGASGPVRCRDRLGGTLRFYYRDAA